MFSSMHIEKRTSPDNYNIIDTLMRHRYENYNGCSTTENFLLFGFNSDDNKISAEALAWDWKTPVVSENGLQLSLVIGEEIAATGDCPAYNYLLNDSDAIVADPAEVKYIKVGVGVDESGNFEMVVFEKTTEGYGAEPENYIMDLKEYSLAAVGDTLVEI